ncbi:MAG TPA: hypothetical protein VGF03_04335 [Bryobacteraceae bacterium]
MEENLAEVQAVRDCIAGVVKAREAHALVAERMDVSVRELNELTGERASVQARLTAREKEIALAGGELPDEPFPEDAEIARLNRHVRIRQEQVRICEGKVRESQEGLDAQILQLEASWSALGAATSERLLKRFRGAAAELQDAWIEYVALSHHFSTKWNPAAWKFPSPKLAIADPMSAELIVNPIHAQVATRWPASAHSILEDVNGLRAEIDAVK